MLVVVFKLQADIEPSYEVKEFVNVNNPAFTRSG
jgi:hypothetical protein